ncbi:MAG TPA: hypothetical protein VF631_05130 [Allosphingosinicella sp.]|jgi:hypothetical protein|uniref:hypothetical protein n=1 Tax=Allosphingosinicella sp. TaxID=2823234 RepID=UPI002F28B03F
MEPKYELIRQAAVTLGVSLVIAAGIIGWSLPEAATPSHYQGFVVNDKIVRLNTGNGNIVACDFSRCVRVLGNGKDLQPNSAPGLTLGSVSASNGRAITEAPPQAKPPQP